MSYKVTHFLLLGAPPTFPLSPNRPDPLYPDPPMDQSIERASE